jgi:hypothetical protein
MFVFKAAVGIPVMLEDVEDRLVQAGLDEARNATEGQVGKLVERMAIKQAVLGELDAATPGHAIQIAVAVANIKAVCGEGTSVSLGKRQPTRQGR